MKYFGSNKTLLTILSGVLYGLALNFVQFYLAWICLVPFFIAIQNYNKKQSFFSGALMGFTLFWASFYWMPQAIYVISKGNIIGAIGVALIVPLAFAAYFGLITMCFSFLKAKKILWINSILMASLWSIGGYLLSVIFPGMPWFSLDMGNTILDNIYAIQPAVFGGIYLLSFFVVLINYLFAHFIVQHKWKKIIVPASLVIIYLAIGYCILFNFKRNVVNTGRTVSVAILSGNIPEDQKWNEETGNVLAKKLLDLNEEALNTKPDIVLWPEGIVPWSYNANDDFIKAVLKSTTSQPDVCHLMGFKTIDKNNYVYNSAYCILPNGNVPGRHDKHYLVALAEHPIGIFSSLFLKDNNDRDYFKVGKDNGVIPTKKVKVGVLICSELFIPEATQKCTQNGAEILVSLSDDVLFASAMGIVRYQFYKNRLRAVEARKDIAASCNMGISGMINAAGEIVVANHQAEGYTQKVELHPNNILTMSYSFSIFVLYISIIIILFFSFINL